MTVKKCDMCKRETERLGKIDFDAKEFFDQSTRFWRDGTGKPIEMLGMRIGHHELCDECFKKISFVISEVWQGKYQPTDPTALST